MAVWMWIFFIFVLCQRIFELKIAKRNEKWMKERGGIEKEGRKYKWFSMLHNLFFVSILLEITTIGTPNLTINYYLFSIFILTQFAKVWCFYVLGRFWNTKLIILPRVVLLKKGPYKYVKHPNHIIVALDLLIIPLLFGAYVTALIYPILHFLLIKIKIPQKDGMLTKAPL